MNLLKFVPIKMTLLLVLGILLGHYFDFGVLVPLTLMVLFMLISALLFFRQKQPNSIRFGAAAGMTTICIGIFAISMAQPKNLPSHYTHQEFEGKHTWQLKIGEVLKPTSFSERAIASVQAIDGKKAAGTLLLNFSIDADTKKPRPDDELLVHATVEPISAPLNPHQFDYRNYMAGLGVAHQLRLEAREYAQIHNASKTIYGRAASLRSHIKENLKEAGFGKEELGIIQALLLGERNDISAETYNDYKNAGAIHILAVSGLHIGILLLLLEFLFRPLERLPKGKTIKLILLVLLLWAFAFLAGLSASVIRAVTMFSFVAYALYLNRPGNTFNILALSMFFILLAIDPKLLFQVGFQMSYTAVFAIIWIYPLLQKLWLPKNKLLRKVWQLLSVSIAAQLGVLPISLFYFHQFPGLFFISNLLIVPFLGVILGIGILTIVLSLLQLLPKFLVTSYNALIGWMNWVIAWVARQEAFIFKNISFDMVQLLFAYIAIIGMLSFWSKATFKRAVLFLTAVIAFQLWLFYTGYQSWEKDSFLVAHQTRNTLLLHRTGPQLTIMTKDSSRSVRIVNDYLVAERVTSIQYRSIRNSLRWKNEKVLLVDSLGIYPSTQTTVDYVIMTGSPKLNFERLIDSLEPKNIIADGSNYRSDINRWRATCEKRKLPFHYTGEKGAYYFSTINQ
ncbi:DUF4131 domain-containing protein [Flavobacteriaceae bacterium TP-CH-4]|uniref:DUF4131 domain-containing protein n=1 Tax=Pelagihabitans pacificus TaxID=2696054 RepID=A0A967AYA4_9FLAO|nr:ComEC/Rec2 family competence protein [Pelagihabitans pacificus]NHF61520.1 DUF4131 domain-containing protein [Pelagihabitans pacificus]